MSQFWGAFFFSILITISGILQLVTGQDGSFWGVNVPAWTGWLLIPIGFVLFLVALRSLLRGEGKEKPPTDEDITKAKAMLEKLYLKEHGTLPEYPEESGEDEKREQKS